MTGQIWVSMFFLAQIGQANTINAPDCRDIRQDGVVLQRQLSLMSDLLHLFEAMQYD